MAGHMNKVQAILAIVTIVNANMKSETSVEMDRTVRFNIDGDHQKPLADIEKASQKQQNLTLLYP